uniref:Peptidase A1 domain-containing protein n=1 Tax=Daucus carota subsp. sativus TaxID=79200 RepID=A0A164TFG6_DAUCS
MASFIHYHIRFCLVIVFLFFLKSEAQVKKAKHAALVFPIRKDHRTKQYLTTLKVSSKENHVEVVINLSSQLTWFNCDIYNLPTYQPIECGSQKCKIAKAEGCSLFCDDCKNCNLPIPSKPGCTNNTCSVDSYNFFTNYLSDQGLGEDTFLVDSTDGLTISFNYKSPKPFQFSCANPIQLRKLPVGSVGMTGLANYTISLPRQMSTLFKLPHKFALCLPTKSDKTPGHMFIGGGPYMFPPYSKDIAKELIITPLVINPQSTAPLYAVGESSKEFFINVKSIVVDGKPVEFNSSLLSFDEEGAGGTKISSITPFTYLETSIFKALVNDFTKAAALREMKTVASVAPFGACFSSQTIAKGQTGPVVPLIDLTLPDNQRWRFYGGNSMVPLNKEALVNDFTKAAALREMKTVASVAPFGACFSSQTIAKGQTGPVVPLIDLTLPDNQRWRFYGGNSMVPLNKEVMCLAFVDAGYKPNPKTSIAIGGYQLENFLIEFDIDSTKLGISTSLLLMNTTCSQSRL